MNRAWILEGAAATAVNPYGEDLLSALLAKKQSSLSITRFDTSRLAYRQAACIEHLEREQSESENLTQTLLRRLLPSFAHLPPADTIIWTGIKGNAEFIEKGGWKGEAACAWPFLPRHYSRWVRGQLGWKKAKIMEVGAACASSAVAIALGADLISSRVSRAVLVVAADIVSRFSFIGFCALRALTASVCRPFDIRRDGLLLGDGAVLIFMAGKEYIREAGQTPWARLTGWAVANDAFHITAPAPHGGGLISAITQALVRAKVKPEDIGAMSAHGTGTVYNDAMELTAIEAVFGDRLFPVFSVKGALGHTFGAAGGIEALICAQALNRAEVPPTQGFQQPEIRACGRVSEDGQKFDKKKILTTNSGFGGTNAALILESMS